MQPYLQVPLSGNDSREERDKYFRQACTFVSSRLMVSASSTNLGLIGAEMPALSNYGNVSTLSVTRACMVIAYLRMLPRK